MLKDKDNTEEKSKKKDSPKDLSSLYMENLLAMSESTTEESYYRHILQSINIGRVLLPKKYDKLKKKASELIKSRDTYPSRRQMELTEGRYYRLGGKNTGSIIVRPDELENGAIEALNQQCSELTPFLKEVDNEIFEILVDEHKLKQRSVKDSIEQNMMSELLEDLQ